MDIRWIPTTALIAFVVLKLSGVIAWSWWWVLSPLWISGILMALGTVVFLVFVYWRMRRRMRRWVQYFTSRDWVRQGLVPPKPDADPDADPGNDQAR